MSSTLDAVVAALTAEFTLEVVFSPSIPAVLTAPSVAPGDPFIVPSTQGGIAGGGVQEMWDILCVVSISSPKEGIDAMRNLSLRVRKAVTSTGARWQQASGARRLATDNSLNVFSLNTVSFIYDPAQHLA
jgi:hypothetical protein